MKMYAFFLMSQSGSLKTREMYSSGLRLKVKFYGDVGSVSQRGSEAICSAGLLFPAVVPILGVPLPAVTEIPPVTPVTGPSSMVVFVLSPKPV